MFRRVWNHYKASYSGLASSAWLLSSIILVNRIGTMVIFFMTLYMTQKLHFSISLAGKMIGVFGLGSLVGAYLGGWLSDKIGSIKVQIYSLFLTSAGLIVLAYLQNPFEIGIALFLVATATDAFRPANSTTMAAICSEKDRARGFALQRLAVNLGVAIGPAVGGYLAKINYSYLFWVDSLTCLLAGILLVVFQNKIIFRSTDSGSHTDKPALSIFKDRTLLTILALLFPLSMVFYQIFNTWSLYLEEFIHLSEDQIGLLFTVNAVIIMLVELPLIHGLSRCKPLKIISMGTFLIGAGFMLMPFGSGYYFIAFTVVLWTFGEILTFPLTVTMIANLANDSNRGKYLGSYTFLFSLAFVTGPPLGAWVYSAIGPNYLWYSAGIIGSIVCLGFLILNSRLNNH